MLKVVKFFLASVVIAATSIMVAGKDASDKHIIIIRSGDPTLPPPTEPNSPTFCSISCTIDSQTGELEVCFLDDIGYVATTVTEFGAGVVTSTMLDSSLGILQLYIPVTPGFYEISFVTAGGEVYTGTFTL